MDDDQLAGLEADRIRLAVVEGHLKVMDRWVDFTELVFRSKDRETAVERLKEPPFSFCDLVAYYLIDLMVWRATEDARQALRDEAIRLRARLS